MNIMKVVAAFAAALAAQNAWAAPTEWAISAGGNGHLYEAVAVSGGIAWQNINVDPEHDGWHLATVTSAEENLFIYSLISDDPRFWRWESPNAAGPWLGAFQPTGSPEPNGDWIWVTGEACSFTCWATGEPCNLGGNENYVHYFARDSQAAATWNDIPGEWLLPGYVRELPEPATIVLLAVGSSIMIMRRRRDAPKHRAV